MLPVRRFSTFACCVTGADAKDCTFNWNGIVKTVCSARRYLAVHLPFLPTERRIAARTAPPDRPFALTEKQRGALRIVALSPNALALGLRLGMTLADARAQLPELASWPHEPDEDAALLEHIATACERYTPMVTIDRHDALLLDLTGCFDSLNMDESDVGRDLSARLARKGLRSRTASAATPDCALALARFGVSRSGDLSIAALGLGDDVNLALRRAGLRSIADLSKRPRAPLAARFGKDMPVRLARLLEEEDRRITPRRAVPPLWHDRRFAEPLATSAPLLAIIGELIEEIRPVMIERQQGGRRFEIGLFRSDGHVARLGVNSGSPLRDPQAVVALFRERIDALADPLDPGFGYDMIRLAVPTLENMPESQDALLDEDRHRAPDLAPLLDRLATRFGADSIACFYPRDAHLPEYAAGLEPPSASPKSPKTSWPRVDPDEPPLRPLYLFDQPQPVTVLAEVPDGPPYRFRWRGVQHHIVRHEGPERIAYPWWKHPEGEGPTRDYYRVEDSDGQRFWLFRHGLYGREKGDPGWYLHGLFA